MLTLPQARPNEVIRRASEGSDTEDFDRFLQARLTLFVRMMASLFAALYVAGAVVLAMLAPEYWVPVHVHPGKILNLLLAVALGVAYPLLHRAPVSQPVLRGIDVAVAVSILTCVGVGVATAPGGYQIEFAGLLVLVVVLILRSAIVPSTALFTVGVGLACSVPLVIGGYVQAQKYPEIGFLSPALVASGILMWCVISTLVAAAVSREIYGLVAQVRKAMQLGRYTLGDKIGEGGMGAVYRADHAMLRRPTAIKLLLPDRVSSAALIRFEREVQLTSQLSHPNTIAIHDYGRTPQGVFYYAMEYLSGRSLEKLVDEEGAQPPGRVVHILQQVAGSLREAHAAGLIHRDIKPGNLLIGRHGGLPDFVKVIDFGLVKQLDSEQAPAVTRTDNIAGTPLFMAPECITRPDSIDARVDTYALGATGYFLLTGMPVFDGQTMVEVCSHHLHSQPLPPSERLGRPLPPSLEALILRCLAKDRVDRPDDDELLRLLGECVRESPWDVLQPLQPSAASAG
ncbi:MAG TPA: serine/threonine-protein kinase [Polyangiales bacterium]|nr:serine/threonine-protein kinase [Polyangiales bacterium]